MVTYLWYNDKGDEMKKIILVMLLFVTTGCSNNTVDSDIERMSKYNSLYLSCLNNGDFSTSSDNFNIELDFSNTESGVNYFIVIDNLKVAMYDVEAIVVEDLVDYNEVEMMPSIGIFEANEYNLIPYQTNKENNFYGGIVISGDTGDKNVGLYALITWKDVTMTKEFKEYVLITEQFNQGNESFNNDIGAIDNESSKS